MKVDALDVQEAWELLARDPTAVLVDVRTEPEWQYVGVPDLASIGKEPALVSWVRYPGTANAAFFEEIEAAGITPDQSLLLLCRSGARSLAAGGALAARGYQRCLNVSDGFEGPLDEDGHRRSGWRGAGLPWRQT